MSNQIVYKTQRDDAMNMLHPLPYRTTLSVVTTFFTVLVLISTDAYGQGMGHNLPQSNLAGRQVFLSFNAPSVASTSEEVDLSLSFMDNATGKNVNHVTYFLTILDPQGNQTFSEVLHGHDGTVSLQFRPGENPYRVNANYDNLAASYVPDQAGIITVTGPVFSKQGTYTVNIEVNGIDFDNTFLPEPIKYQYPLTVGTTTVPEFSSSLPLVAAAGFFVIVFLFSQKKRFVV
jgi:hypothetical protein